MQGRTTQLAGCSIGFPTGYDELILRVIGIISEYDVVLGLRQHLSFQQPVFALCSMLRKVIMAICPGSSGGQ